MLRFPIMRNHNTLGYYLTLILGMDLLVNCRTYHNSYPPNYWTDLGNCREYYIQIV